MKSYYEHGGITIYNGDCRDVLPSLSRVDLVLTDPPYGIGKMISGTITKERLHKTRYTAFDDSPDYVNDVCVPAFKMAISISDRAILTPGSRCMHLYPVPASFGCLHSESANGMQLWGSMDAQPIFYYGKPHDIGKRIHRCSYAINEPPSCDEHPCSKPIKLWKRILFDRSEKDQTVLDPFMGSGTTLRAAKDLGRKAIGIEIDERYCEIAAKRLAQEVLPL